jgi:hypothetical protein
MVRAKSTNSCRAKRKLEHALGGGADVVPSKRRVAKWFYSNCSPKPLLGGVTDDEDEDGAPPTTRARSAFNVFKVPETFGVTDPLQKKDLVDALRRLPDNVANVVELTRAICKPTDNVDQIKQVIKSVDKINGIHQRELVDVAIRFGDYFHWQSNDVCMFLEFINSIPFDEVADVTRLTHAFASPYTEVTVFQIKRVVLEILQILPEQRVSFLATVQRWFDFQKLSCVNQIADVLKKMLAIPLNELETTIMRSVERMVSRRASNLPYKEKIQILENEMLGTAQAAASLASDVHSSDRDKRTREAVQKLNLIEMSPSEAPKYVEACSEYVREKLGSNDTLDSLLLSAEFEYQGIVINGRDFVARLWHFATTVDDTQEAKLSLVSALIDAKACNEGKVQRLVVGVLQGRLPGVEIDKLDHAVRWTDYLQAFNFRHKALMERFLTLKAGTPEEAACISDIRLAADKFCIAESIWFKPFWDTLRKVLFDDDDDDDL